MKGKNDDNFRNKSKINNTTTGPRNASIWNCCRSSGSGKTSVFKIPLSSHCNLRRRNTGGSSLQSRRLPRTRPEVGRDIRNHGVKKHNVAGFRPRRFLENEVSVSGYDGICPYCKTWFLDCECAVTTEKQMEEYFEYLREQDHASESNPYEPQRDSCGNCWYPFEVARHWSIGVPVLVRVVLRENGLYNHSICSWWQSPGINTFGESAMFLMLDRMPQ